VCVGRTSLYICAHNLTVETRYREIHNYVQYIKYTIACYTKYESNEESYRDEQFNKPSTYSFIYVINEFV
jgi:hypothetical protein